MQPTARPLRILSVCQRNGRQKADKRFADCPPPLTFGVCRIPGAGKIPVALFPSGHVDVVDARSWDRTAEAPTSKTGNDVIGVTKEIGSSSPASILALPANPRFFLDFAGFPNFQGAKGFGNIHRHSSQTHQMTQSKDRSQESPVSDGDDLTRAV